MTTYRISVLAYALQRMWRCWRILVPVVIVNAIIQALLVWPDVQVTAWLPLIGLAIVSALSFMVSYGLVAAAALRVPDGTVRVGQIAPALRASALRYSLWALALFVVTVVGLAVFVIPGVVVLAITPFVLLAVIDGQRNPLATNFRVIGQQFWRWLSVTMFCTALIGVGTFLVGLTNFFVRGPAAAFAVWIVAGFVLSWFVTAWGLIYRRANHADGPRVA